MSHSYAQSLRAIGELLEQSDISAIDLRKCDDVYTLQIRRTLSEKDMHSDAPPSSHRSFLKKISQILGLSQSVEKPWSPPPSKELRRYTASDIQRLIAEQRAKHGAADKMPDGHKISQVLRVAGDWLDRRNANTFDVSFCGQTLSIRYDSPNGEDFQESLDTRNLYDLSIQMYLRRAKRLNDSQL